MSKYDKFEVLKRGLNAMFGLLRWRERETHNYINLKSVDIVTKEVAERELTELKIAFAICENNEALLEACKRKDYLLKKVEVVLTHNKLDLMANEVRTELNREEI